MKIKNWGSFTGLVMILFLSNLNLQAQVPMGAYTSDDVSNLETADAQLNNLSYYKSLIIELKKGEGIFIYMTASTFEPQIYMVDNALINWVTGENIDNGDNTNSSYLTLVADKDTVFNVVFTSVTPAITGEFGYGIKKLDATQMHYPESNEFCGRLTYIINNWLCFWKFLPVSFSGSFTQTIKNTILNDNSGYIGFSQGYSETFIETDSSELAKNKYDEYVEMVKRCLDLQFWDVTTNYDAEFDGSLYYETFFTLKGGTPGAYLQSFAIQFIDNEDFPDTVEILFY